mmetsp:Transcript_36609/g.85574  ORF Transcript_36609/g.85574 Transcript_36609/m.85574 type:complete len:91 (+) Transcript_36609:25-297(+)
MCYSILHRLAQQEVQREPHGESGTDGDRRAETTRSAVQISDAWSVLGTKSPTETGSTRQTQQRDGTIVPPAENAQGRASPNTDGPFEPVR